MARDGGLPQLPETTRYVLNMRLADSDVLDAAGVGAGRLASVEAASLGPPDQTSCARWEPRRFRRRWPACKRSCRQDSASSSRRRVTPRPSTAWRARASWLRRSTSWAKARARRCSLLAARCPVPRRGAHAEFVGFPCAGLGRTVAWGTPSRPLHQKKSSAPPPRRALSGSTVRTSGRARASRRRHPRTALGDPRSRYQRGRRKPQPVIGTRGAERAYLLHVEWDA